MTQNDRATLAHIIEKARDAAAGGFGALSTGEKLAAGLVLNRPDWLQSEGYTIAEALDRLGPTWVALLPAAAKQLAREADAVAEGLAKARYSAAVDSFFTGDEVHLRSKLVTYGNAPGYRDATLIFDVEQLYANGPQAKARIDLRIRPEDAESIVRHLRDVHSFAWRDGRRPIDAKEGESRPLWLDR